MGLWANFATFTIVVYVYVYYVFVFVSKAWVFHGIQVHTPAAAHEHSLNKCIHQHNKGNSNLRGINNKVFKHANREHYIGEVKGKLKYNHVSFFVL